MAGAVPVRADREPRRCSSRTRALRALTPVLVGDPEEGIFAASTAFSRLRVQQVFEAAVIGANDAPKQPLAEALGRLLYLIHLAVLLWWLLDKSRNQRATARSCRSRGSCCRRRPRAACSTGPEVRDRRRRAVREALFGNPVAV